MANKTTVALTKEQYIEIITAMKTGGMGFRPNERVATALMLEANLGMRISDILALTPKSIIRDGNRYRLNITEKKTKKKRLFTVPNEIFAFIKEYCKKYQLQSDDRLFPFTERNVQKYLEKVAYYLDYENIGTHSFRKMFASEIYRKTNNLILVQRLLNHSSPTVSERYLGIGDHILEQTIADHVYLIQ